MKRAIEPETRVGICCGDECRREAVELGTWKQDALFKIPGVYRYRCAMCFEIETGHRHHMDPRDLNPREPTADDLKGIAWWNALSEVERLDWLVRADTSVPQRAWSHFKRMQETEAKAT